MSELTADGYQSLREFAVSDVPTPAEWDYIALYDDTKTEVLRLSVSGDVRFDWIDIDGDAIIKMEGVITGGDSDVSLPQTFEYSAAYDAASGGRQITEIEQFPVADLNQPGDDVTITHTIELPNQP